MIFFFFKQKTAYEMRISDWSSDVCSSDLRQPEKLDTFLCVGEGMVLSRDLIALTTLADRVGSKITILPILKHLHASFGIDLHHTGDGVTFLTWSHTKEGISSFLLLALWGIDSLVTALYEEDRKSVV